VKRFFNTLGRLVLLNLIATKALAADLGDPAGKLDIASWVKGEPIDLAKTKGKKTVVVEFWATWCGPCKVSIPHLTEMSKKFASKDVVFVGVSDEEVSKVKPFVEKMGEKMDYTVAVDRDNKTGDAYMKAYGINGIPHAFVVDKQNRIIWQGHPMGGLDKALEKITDGTYDLAMEKKRAGAQQKLEKYFELASVGASEENLEALGKELVALDKELGGIREGQTLDLVDLRNRARFQSAMMDYRKAVAAGKSEADLEKIEKQATAVAPKGFSFADFKEQMRVNQVFQQYYSAARTGNQTKAKEWGAKLGELQIKNPEVLNNIAWTILTDENLKSRDTKLALKLAKAANDASDGKTAHILDTYARALFDNGDKAEAVKTQKRAIELAEDADRKAEYEKSLQRYR
jgi:thiol-disulfide isomerase/thioredoxin